jgi:hypothetical protein
MKRVLFAWSAVFAVFALGWGVYMASAESDAKWQAHINELSVGGPYQEVRHPSPVGLWVGGIAAVALLVAGTAVPSTASRGSRRKCPHCAEDIAAAAKVCKHCGREVELSSPSPGSDLAALRRGLLSQDPDVRFRSADAIGDLGAAAADALADLGGLFGDPDGRVRQRAKWAAEEIRDKIRKAPRP